MIDSDVIIIDYDMGNIGSIANMLKKVGYKSVITSDHDIIADAKKLILPGVGSAADTMRNLEKSGMAETMRQFIFEGRPLFAVCVGMQVLLSWTEEGGGKQCLGIVPGTVDRLPAGLKVPHMGWNQVKQKVAHPIFTGIPDEANFYFVHSYYANPEDTSVIAGITNYGVDLCSVLIKGNLIATQFHPEKSGEYGLRMYANFLQIALNGRLA